MRMHSIEVGLEGRAASLATRSIKRDAKLWALALAIRCMDLTTLEGTDTTGDDTPKMFHYVLKAKIAESAVLGNLVVALCGETFPVTRSPKPGSPVCPECKKIYESMPSGGE